MLDTKMLLNINRPRREVLTCIKTDDSQSHELTVCEKKNYKLKQITDFVVKKN